MADIKVKQSKKGTVKTINKAVVGTEKMKDRLVQAKDKTKETYQEETSNSGTEYAIDNITKTIYNVPHNVYKTNRIGRNNFRKTQENIYKTQETIKNIKHKQKVKQRARNISRIRKNSMRTSKIKIKVADRTSKKTKQIIKISKKGIDALKRTAKVSVDTTKKIVKVTISTIKTVITGTKALVAAIIAGGYVSLIIIIIICLIGLLCGSFMGIFFSSEIINGKNMTSIISEINNEFISKITDIQNATQYNEYDIQNNHAEWKDVLAIYTVKISNGKDNTDVITISEEKMQVLKTIFWDMNNITSNIEMGNEGQTILHIVITSKSVEEMMQTYNFSEKQKEQVTELLNEKYAKMWTTVIYGSSVGSSDIVEVARKQVGNIGGQIYWSWYGFNSRVEWCACFVSWCANECGYIQAGIIPRFAECQREGVDWFKTCGLWQDRNYIPKSGDVIFFDWADSNDGQADHVGIVEKVEDNKIFTIEGNSKGDMCRQNVYDINSNVILGYGTPKY